WWAYLRIGAAVGFLAGLLGIGGGMVMVPMLFFVLSAKGFPPEHLMHFALATALAAIALVKED
ncbi:MAG: TSUP family transporter, partial [Geminicoccales bacterium]